jgi:hypothetical protein
MLEFVLFVDGIVDIQYRAARIAEHMFNAFFGQTAY